MKVWLFIALLPLVSSTGAFGTLWLVDLRRDMPAASELLTLDHPTYGINKFVMAASHHTQYYYELWAVYLDDVDSIEDPSDVYLKYLRGERRLVWIGSMTFLLFMAKLMPMLMRGTLPWHEIVVQSNDYPNESGCRVTVRSHLEPMAWWLRIGSELSIVAGKRRLAAMLQHRRL